MSCCAHKLNNKYEKFQETWLSHAWMWMNKVNLTNRSIVCMYFTGSLCYCRIYVVWAFLILMGVSHLSIFVNPTHGFYGHYYHHYNNQHGCISHQEGATECALFLTSLFHYCFTSQLSICHLLLKLWNLVRRTPLFPSLKELTVTHKIPSPGIRLGCPRGQQTAQLCIPI